MMTKKQKIKVNLKLSALKNNAIRLRINHQLPFYLTYVITKLEFNSDDELVSYLKTQSEHLLRIKGYYKKYPKIEKDCEELLKQDLHRMGYSF